MSKPVTACVKCGNTKFWRGKLAGSDWFCVVCQPVPVPSMLGELVDVLAGDSLVESASNESASEPAMYTRDVPYVRCYVDTERGS